MQQRPVTASCLRMEAPRKRVTLRASIHFGAPLEDSLGERVPKGRQIWSLAASFLTIGQVESWAYGTHL